MPAVKKIGIYSLHFFKLSKHMLTHVVIGLLYAWFLRLFWVDLSTKYMVMAVVGSVLIDFDHVAYFFTYGRREWYATQARKLMKLGQFKNLCYFLKEGHKHNTGLATHNVYYLGFFLVLSIISFQYDWVAGVVLFGSIVLHFLFDIADDLWVLGHLNDNWKRLRRKTGEAPKLAFFEVLKKK